jgi:replicative DNA helicase
MADEVAHGRVVLSAVLSAGGSAAALNYATERLTPPDVFFTDFVQLRLFLLLERYERQTGGIITREALSDLLSDSKPGTAQMYEEAYDALAAVLPEPHQFRHSVSQLREMAAKRATGDAMATGRLILGASSQEPVRLDDGQPLHGHADARAYVLAAFADAEQAAGQNDSPGGDVTREGDSILAAYAAVKEQRKTGKVAGIEFGLGALDAHLDGGLGKGEVALIAAGTTAGKSSLCVQCAWYNAVLQGRNVLVFTTEQLRAAVRVKIVARHSRHPKFGLRAGINSARIRAGRLGEEEERALAAVVDDLKNGGYGTIDVVQMPEQCTLSVMAGRAASIARRVVPDLVIVDYLQLFDPDRKSRDSRQHENQSGVIKGAARWAQSFRHGDGVPVISPWQVNKDGVGKMRSGGEYTLEDLSETIEAARTPSMVLGLMTSEEDNSSGRAAPVELKVLKNRDGPRGRKFPLTADFATSHFADRDQAGDEDPINFD